MARTPAPKPTVVVFVRHGKTPTTGQVLPGRAKGLHLSDVGQAQAAEAAERIVVAYPKVDAIYMSPLERTRETAAPIAKALGLKAKVEKGLLECDFGDWTGRSLKELNKLPEWKTVQHHPSGFRFPNGESFMEMQTRITDTVSRLCAENSGKTIVVVSHADPIKAVLASAMGTPLDLFQRINVSPCSISAVVYGDYPAVLCVNSTDLKGLKAS